MDKNNIVNKKTLEKKDFRYFKNET